MNSPHHNLPVWKLKAFQTDNNPFPSYEEQTREYLKPDRIDWRFKHQNGQCECHSFMQDYFPELRGVA